MKHPWKSVLLGAAIAAVLMIAGCSGLGDTTANLAFSVDLSPVYAQGLVPDSVTAKVVSGSKVVEKALAITASTKKASGTITGIAEGTWDATVTIKAGQTVLGKGSGQVTASAKATNTITVTVVIPLPPTDPAIDVIVE
jgi:hypothetical protein